jgi:hypothetical protein
MPSNSYRFCQLTAVSFHEISELMGFGTSKDMEQRFLTTAQKPAKYGAAAE